MGQVVRLNSRRKVTRVPPLDVTNPEAWGAAPDADRGEPHHAPASGWHERESSSPIDGDGGSPIRVRIRLIVEDDDDNEEPEPEPPQPLGKSLLQAVLWGLVSFLAVSWLLR